MSTHLMESVMYGEIVKFNSKLGFGVIETATGERFRFAKSAVKNPNGKLVGYGADFLMDARQPRDIFLMHGTPWTAFDQSSSHG
jgi:hypothetical protein